ncbi:MAG: hypothetical protein Q8K45_21280 [Rubrivivax sp.]|nr:hypothetical protein [Rubrivivax sp.]
MSTRGRKPGPTPEAGDDNLDQGALAAANLASQVMSAASVETMQAAEIYKLVGRIETAHFMETVSGKLIAQAYVQARDLLGKMGEITVRGSGGEWKRVSGMEEFCDLAMPVSARRCRQIVAAIEVLGGDLYEQAERIGFRARDYQALKALPNDDQALVKQALDGGDKDAVLDLLTELAARNDALRKQADTDKKALAAKDKVIQAKSAKLDKIDEEAAARRNATMEEAEAFQVEDLRRDTLEAEASLLRLLATVDEVMGLPATESAEKCARHSMDYLVQRLVDGCLQRGITVDLADRVSPIWATQLEEAAAAAPRRSSKK